MKAGYMVEHCLQHDCLGEEYQIAEVMNLPNANQVHTFYWDAYPIHCNESFTTAIFRLYPGRTNPRRWMRGNLKTTDNE